MDLRDLLAIEHPLIQAPMAGAQNHLLAAAVCGAGGLGSIPAGMLDAQALERELSAIEALTDRPYNVNFFCHQTPTADPAHIAAWHQLLAPYFAEFGVDPAQIPSGATRSRSMRRWPPYWNSTVRHWSASISACPPPIC